MGRETEVLVIGSGPGGYVAAVRAAELGMKVAVIESDNIGGVCLHRGCIPSKALISAAHEYDAIKQAAASPMGIAAQGVSIDFQQVQSWKQDIVMKLAAGIKGLFKGHAVETIRGKASFISPREVEILQEEGTVRYRFGKCIIAAGSIPVELPSLPFGGRILSSTEALSLSHIPASLLVVGGGYIGAEIGQAYAKMGSNVTILEAGERILAGFGEEMTRVVSKQFKRLGMTILTGVSLQGVEWSEKEATVRYVVGQDVRSLSADYVLVTVGRRPNTAPLGLEAAGVKTDDRRYIEVDRQGRTSNPDIYAIGDVVHGPALAHKASYEGKVAAEAIAGQASQVDYKAIPAVVFTDPEMAAIGLTEREAEERKIPVVTGKYHYQANGYALTRQAGDGFVKMIANADTEEIVGAQIVGLDASNLIAEFAHAIEVGSTLRDITLTIHTHPTLSELVMEAGEVALKKVEQGRSSR